MLRVMNRMQQDAYGAAKVLAEPKAEGCAAAAGAGNDVANDANGLGAAERGGRQIKACWEQASSLQQQGKAKAAELVSLSQLAAMATADRMRSTHCECAMRTTPIHSQQPTQPMPSRRRHHSATVEPLGAFAYAALRTLRQNRRRRLRGFHVHLARTRPPSEGLRRRQQCGSAARAENSPKPNGRQRCGRLVDCCL